MCKELSHLGTQCDSTFGTIGKVYYYYVFKINKL